MNQTRYKLCEKCWRSFQDRRNVIRQGSENLCAGCRGVWFKDVNTGLFRKRPNKMDTDRLLTSIFGKNLGDGPDTVP